MSWYNIKQGSSRTVIVLRNYVIKLPAFNLGWRPGLNGLLANMQETVFSRWQDKLLKNNNIDELALCPVTNRIPGGFALIMYRAYPVDLAIEQCCDIIRKNQRNGFNIPAEAKPQSFGQFGPYIVAIDYGNNNFTNDIDPECEIV